MKLWNSIEHGKLTYNDKEKLYQWEMDLEYERKLGSNKMIIQATRGEIVHIDVNTSFCYPMKTAEETIELNKQVFQETYQQELLDIISLSEHIKRAPSLFIQTLHFKDPEIYSVSYFTIKEFAKEIKMFLSPSSETMSFAPKTIQFSKDVAEVLKETLFSHSIFRLKLLPYKHYKTV